MTKAWKFRKWGILGWKWIRDHSGGPSMGLQDTQDSDSLLHTPRALAPSGDRILRPESQKKSKRELQRKVPIRYARGDVQTETHCSNLLGLKALPEDFSGYAKGACMALGKSQETALVVSRPLACTWRW